MINFKKSEGHKFAESPVLLPKLASWRSRTVFILILFSLAALIGAAYNLQVLNNDFFLGQGESRYLREIELPASRGQIADRHGEVLAISTLRPTSASRKRVHFFAYATQGNYPRAQPAIA